MSLDDRALSQVVVESVDPGGQDLDEDVTPPRTRRFDVLVAENLRPSEAPNNGCFHLLPPS